MSPNPCALLLDDGCEMLAPVALRLIRMGVEVLYTKWEDEARLLAYQAAGRVQTIVATPRVEIDALAIAQSAVEKVSPQEETPVIVIGAPPDTAQRDRLRKAGVSNSLFEPYDDGELRFVVNACTIVPSEIAPRREPRAPVNQLCWLRIGTTRSFGVVYTLSAKGAYVEMAQPLPVGSNLALEFDFDGLALEAAIRVLYRITPEQARSTILPCGIGALFTDLPVKLEEKVREFARQRAARYTL